jgi:anti-sigma B factor antagonist
VEDGIEASAQAGASVFSDSRYPCLGSRIDSLAFQVEELRIDDVEVIVLKGEFDAYSMPLLGDQLDAAIERGDYEVVVDMCGVTFVDMSTLNRIVRAMKEIYRHNGHLVIACGDKHVLRAIDLAGLRHSVRVYDTRDEAIGHLRDRAEGP